MALMKLFLVMIQVWKSHTLVLLTYPPQKTFHFHDTLGVPNLHKNLISIHYFTKHNDVFIKFHPFYFLMKEQTMRAILLKSACENDVYLFSTSMVASSPPKMVTNVHE